MPQVPTLPPDMLQSAGAFSTMPTDPANYLMAAADLHSKGEFQSMPVPRGKDLQTGKPSGKRHRIQVVK